jgi:hydroxymethylpyrimidine/phosphomethylpyrimidine kinase
VSSNNDVKQEIVKYVQQSTQAQGVPEKVTDPVVIAKLQAMCATQTAPDQD